jgi:ABC-2 type transport system permease protein
MFDWGRIRLIALRELTTRFKQRSFRWTLIVQVLIAAIAGLAPVAMAWFNDGGSSNATLAVIDEADSGIADRLGTWLDAQGNLLPAIEIQTDISSPDDARAAVDDGDVGHALIVSQGQDGLLAYELVTEGEPALDVDVQRIVGAVTSFSVEYAAEQQGLSADEAQSLISQPVIRVENPSGDVGESPNEVMDFSSAEFTVAYVGAILIYIAIILYGTWIATGVAEEKGSRIMEIMVNAATPRDLMVGKILGIMLAGMAQLLPMLLVAGTLFALQPRIADAVGVELATAIDIDFASLSVKAVGWFIVYFLLGFLLYGGLYAGIGSMVSRQEEVNQAVSPMMMLVVISFFGSIIAINVPDSLLAKVLMILPLSSPFVALPRLLVGSPPAWEIALSVGLLAVSAFGTMWIASKLYRAGVLLYGQRPGWKNLVRLGRMQQVAR